MDGVRGGILEPNAMEWIANGLKSEDHEIQIFLIEGIVWLTQDGTQR
jgi:hypothetical protein